MQNEQKMCLIERLCNSEQVYRANMVIDISANAYLPTPSESIALKFLIRYF